MKKRCLILGLFLALPASAAPVCSEVFTEIRTESAFDSLAPFYVPPVKTLNTSLATTSFFREAGAIGLYRTDIHKLTGGDLQHSREFRTVVEENINFVISEYSQRRDWKPEYLKAIRDDAFVYASRVTYFVSRRLKHWDDSGQIVGTLKVISGSEQALLPFEKDHGIRVETNNGRKFEPGNFVVLKEENQLAFSEVMLQFINFARQLQKDPGHVPGKMVFFTDADRASALMYRQLGFKPVPGFEKPLIKEGKEFYLIGASAEDVLGFVDVFSRKRPEWQGEHALGFARLAEIVQRRDLSEPDIWGRSFGKLAVFNRKGGGDSGELLTVHISKNRETSKGFGARLSIDRQGISGVQVNYLIPDGQVVKEGWEYQPRAQLRMKYQGGILEIHESIGTMEEIFLIKTNPTFTEIEGVHYRKLKFGELALELVTK